ncbi:probable splicing factor 3A subunit 1 [Arabidopsis lyrata subsp. lyrata]|uniref:probable splicing factor 3A subunit 1 n=1 Tax=Arabidopsis lyrata subsp. lyrata TaxID=81972 RepID=UPI000A29D4A1|nr:probable splicing factor 3A subunit 1 [Arabidopsis lyrata subsp. lyrata]|eukprot:XP_020886814.1 probable splicing factor 3A subunit 1 [Arabidopsis lyrata subsp. lyrata]
MLTDLQEEGANQDNALAALPHLAHPPPIHLPDGLEFRRPKGMNGKEFKTMKLTAQFGAWYGNDFWLGFKNRAGFEFTNPTHSNFPRFTRFVLEYSQVLKPPQDLKEKVSKNDTYLAAIHDGFFRLLQSDFLQEMEWRLGGVVSMTDWHSSLDKDFPNDKEELPPPPPGTGTGMSSPLEPEPNTQKIDEPAGLVPEEQFLAQHLGWCTIRVSVTDIDGCELLVIEKTVQSLSENVASFKEKIAEEMGIPPERQVLYCKAGLLEENNKSLAHYNVGAGEILTLSLCACGRRGDMNKACRCMEMLAEALMLSLQKYDLQNN